MMHLVTLVFYILYLENNNNSSWKVTITKNSWVILGKHDAARNFSVEKKTFKRVFIILA